MKYNDGNGDVFHILIIWWFLKDFRKLIRRSGEITIESKAFIKLSWTEFRAHRAIFWYLQFSIYVILQRKHRI